MSVYYNEIDPFCCQWLRNLIVAGHLPPGEVDERDIRLIQPEDLSGFDDCHFFAGIGGWPLAIRLAGYEGGGGRIWTASCPCQPFSSAGKAGGVLDERHLWPAFRRLIPEHDLPDFFGEQVASADGRAWFAGIRLELEALGLVVGGADLCAAGVGAFQLRNRIYWSAHPSREHGHAHDRVVTRRERRAQVTAGGFSGPLVAGRWWRERAGSARLPTLVRNFNGLSRVLAGFGNAIVPELAAAFVDVAMSCRP